MRTPNTYPCSLTRGVRLREVKNVAFEKRNRRDHGLVSANGKCPLKGGSVSGGSAVYRMCLLLYYDLSRVNERDLSYVV